MSENLCNVISFQSYAEKKQNPIEKLCETTVGKYDILGYIVGMIKFQDEQSNSNDVVRKLFECLDDYNKQIVLEYATGELRKAEVM